MKSSNWKLGALAAMAVAAAGFASQTHAGTITLVTSVPTISLAGEAVGVDIVVDGLPSAAGGFTLDLDYGNLTFDALIVGPGGTFGTSPDDFSSDAGGSVSFVAFYDFLESLVLDDAAAFAVQNSGASFVIAHVDFFGIAAGDFALGLRNVAVSNWLGDTQDPAFNLLIGGNNVPEPMTALLVAVALGGLALTRKQKAA